MNDTKENILKGVAAAPGISICSAYLYTKEVEAVQDDFITDVEEAKKNLHEALEKSKKELGKIFSLAVDKLGEKRAAIFEAQMMILDDPVLMKNIIERIENEKKLPEYIVDDEITKYQNLLKASNELYMKERSHDIEDIKNRIIRNLKKKKWQSKIKNEVIVVTESITPADTVVFSRSNIKGYVTNFGGLTSHAAIVARSLNIPAVVGVHDATKKIKDDDTLIIDGFHGDIIVNPDREQLEHYNKKIEKLNRYDSELLKIKDEPAITLDGHKIELMGNMDLLDEIEFIIQSGAKGIGLVRTEQIFQEIDGFPDEKLQYEVYENISQKIYPQFVTIRAFDIGGDKVLPVDVKEPNPFLGWRGIRFLIDNLPLFKTQIRAVLRASIHKNIYFLIPMVSSIKEVRKLKEIIKECEEELKKEELKFDASLKLGIMIEVPSAAIMVREFAEEADFISIGTNDLIQYLLAVDRTNDIVSDQYQEFHPSVIRMLKHIFDECQKCKTKVSLCGEMAADILAIPLLVGLGLNSISSSPSALPYIKKVIRGIKYKEVKKLADRCLKYKTEIEISNELKHFLQTHLIAETETIL
ncbi:MAG: phosphoenolpyruvate--protein phosphotransferase [Ignavibacteria bacterium]|jgi:phosphotransferase system enzyme I (PtsI)